MADGMHNRIEQSLRIFNESRQPDRGWNATLYLDTNVLDRSVATRAGGQLNARQAEGIGCKQADSRFGHLFGRTFDDNDIETVNSR